MIVSKTSDGIQGSGEASKEREFDLHDLLHLSSKSRMSPANLSWNSFFMEYANHETGVKRGTDLEVVFGPFSPKTEDTVLLDDRHLVSSNYFACLGESYKWAKWKFDIMQQQGTSQLRVHHNLAGSYFVNSAVVEPVISALATSRGWGFLHAGGVVSDGEATLFSGRGGSGKSSLCLKLAADGFGYLADDRIILADQRALGIKSHLNVFSYNFGNLPRRAKSVARRFSISLREAVRIMSGGSIKVFMKINPYELFPSQPNGATVDRVCILRQGKELKWSPVDRRTALRQLALNERLEHSLASEHFLTAEYSGSPEVLAGHWNRYRRALDGQLGESVVFGNLELPRFLDSIPAAAIARVLGDNE